MELILNSIKIETPLGEMIAIAHNHALLLLEFSDKKALDKEISILETKFSKIVNSKSNQILEQLKVELLEYFAKKREEFTIPIEMFGTDFQKSVWNYLLTIPYGKQKTYKEQALEMENLLGIRAIATCNGKNILSIIVPCHRVLGSDGSLTGYAGGIKRKEFLLNLESKNQQLTIF